MANIDFKFPCPACRHQSGQCARKPSPTSSTSGWLKCPECLCDFLVQLTFNYKKRLPNGQPSLQIATTRWKQSKRHADRIAAQKERDAKKAVGLGPKPVIIDESSPYPPEVKPGPVVAITNEEQPLPLKPMTVET